MTKLAADSIYTLDDQVRFYEEQMGYEAADRQVRLARLAAGKCVCTTQKLKRRWNGEGSKMTTRVVHDTTCPRFKDWMAVAF